MVIKDTLFTLSDPQGFLSSGKILQDWQRGLGFTVTSVSQESELVCSAVTAAELRSCSVFTVLLASSTLKHPFIFNFIFFFFLLGNEKRRRWGCAGKGKAGIFLEV